MEIIKTSDGGLAYVGGATAGDRNDADFYLCKTDSSANIEWDRTFRLRPNGRDAADMAFAVRQLTDNGFCLVGGGGGGSIGTIVRTNSEGNQLWIKYFRREDGYSGLQACELSDDGNLVVISNNMAAKISLEQEGDVLWQCRYGGGASVSFWALSKASDNGFLLAGEIITEDGEGKDFYAIRIDEGGDTIWERRFGTENSDICGGVCAILENGWNLIGGSRFGVLDSIYTMVVRIDENGNEIWRHVYDQLGMGTYLRDIVPTADDGFTVLGEQGSPDKFFMLRLDWDGEIKWYHRYNDVRGIGLSLLVMRDRGYLLLGGGGPAVLARTGPDPYEAQFEFELIDDYIDFGATPVNTDVYEYVGIVDVGTRSGRIQAIRFTQGGDRFSCELDSTRIFPGDTLQLRVGYHPVSEAHSFGRLRITMSGDTIFNITLRGDGAPNGVDTDDAIAAEYRLFGSYPNPFNSTSTIIYSIPTSGEVLFRIVDLSGRNVKTLVSESQEAGYHKVIWNTAGAPAGVYFCRFEAGSEVRTQKLTLIR